LFGGARVVGVFNLIAWIVIGFGIFRNRLRCVRRNGVLMKFSTIGLIGLVFGLGACSSGHQGTSTGNSIVFGLKSLSSALSQDADASATTLVAVEDADGTALSLNSAVANIGRIELYLPAGHFCSSLDSASLGGSVSCEDDDSAGGDGESKLTISGSYVVDFFAKTVTPSLGSLVLPALTYRRIDVRFDKDGGSVQLGDNTVLASGTWEYEQDQKSFEIALEFNEEVRFRSSGGVSLSSGIGQNLLLLLDADAWFSALPLKECVDDGDLSFDASGKVSIADHGSGGCSDIENDLKDAIKDSGELDITDSDD
jgi:hypothetical protein